MGGDLDRDNFDFLLAQRPVRNEGRGPCGRSFSPASVSRSERTAARRGYPYNVSGWFRSTGYLIHDISSLHEAFERVRTCVDTDGEPSYVILGELAPGASPASAPRSKHPSTTAGTQEAARAGRRTSRFWLVLDLDKVPNGLGLDPRHGDEARAAVVAYLRGLLPDELHHACCSWQLSSSMCVFGPDGLPLPADTPPARLGAHLRYWLDTGLDESARRQLLQRIGERVRAELASRGLESGAGAGVDPRDGHLQPGGVRLRLL